jgi:hypothetical protein
MIAAAVALWAVTESRDPGTRQLDLVGAGLATGGLFALVWALIETGTHARGSAYTLGFGRGRPARRLLLLRGHQLHHPLLSEPEGILAASGRHPLAADDRDDHAARALGGGG